MLNLIKKIRYWMGSDYVDPMTLYLEDLKDWQNRSKYQVLDASISLNQRIKGDIYKKLLRKIKYDKCGDKFEYYVTKENIERVFK